MAESTGRIGYLEQVLPYLSPAKQSYRARYAELANREPCMAESAGRIGYPVQVLPYPSPAEQSYRDRLPSLQFASPE
jgi:hypothetical protein